MCDTFAFLVEALDALAVEDKTSPRSSEGLVGGRGDDVGVLERVRVFLRGDKPADVRHVGHHDRADLVAGLGDAWI